MPSGPKKGRAELRKKNDPISKTSSNPPSHTHEETRVAAVDQFDQKTIDETPLTVDGYEYLEKTEEKGKDSESVDDKINLTDTNRKKTEPNERRLHDQPPIVNPPVMKDTVENLSSEPRNLSFLDSQVPIDASFSYEKPAIVKPDDSSSKVILGISSKKPQDILKEPLKSNTDDPPASVHPSLSVGLKSVEASLLNQNEIGPEVKLLEQLLSISAEIGFQAEKQVSLAKDFTRLLEELKFGKLK